MAAERKRKPDREVLVKVVYPIFPLHGRTLPVVRAGRARDIGVKISGDPRKSPHMVVVRDGRRQFAVPSDNVRLVRCEGVDRAADPAGYRRVRAKVEYDSSFVYNKREVNVFKAGRPEQIGLKMDLPFELASIAPDGDEDFPCCIHVDKLRLLEVDDVASVRSRRPKVAS